ncbi:hypothetical protein IFR05_005746 [Cadophora sp. M221]|nr:hypothetical protein IFR05_005746 [Cadophora sp. M221]
MSSKMNSEGVDMQYLSTTLATTILSSSPNTSTSPVSSISQPAEPLKAFHPFPFLPAELRLEIWTLALPPPKRFYTVSISISIKPSGQSSKPNSPLTEQETNVAFKIHLPNPLSTIKTYPLSKSHNSSSILDIGMLLTNKEARSIYLSANPSSIPLITLPTPPTTPHPPLKNKGKLHFNPSKTTFYIPNYTSNIQRNEALVRFIKDDDDGNAIKGLKIQLGDIRHLATRGESFYPSVERGTWSGRGGGPSIRIFPNLETWYCVHGESVSEIAAEEEMRRARRRLEVFRERIEGDWMVPRVEILEL